jgi:hypothetical protein
MTAALSHAIRLFQLEHLAWCSWRSYVSLLVFVPALPKSALEREVPRDVCDARPMKP